MINNPRERERRLLLFWSGASKSRGEKSRAKFVSPGLALPQIRGPKWPDTEGGGEGERERRPAVGEVKHTLT